MSVDFLNFLKLPSSEDFTVENGKAVLEYARDPTAFAEGYDDRFRAAVHCAWLERMLPADYPGFSARVFAPKWRGLYTFAADPYYYEGTRDAPFRLFREEGVPSIKEFCKTAYNPLGLQTKLWIIGGVESDLVLSDAAYGTLPVYHHDTGGESQVLAGEASGLIFLTDEKIDELNLWRAHKTPFNYRPWAEEAEGIFPYMHRTLYSPNLGTWGSPAFEVNFNPSWIYGGLYGQPVVFSGVGALALSGTRTTKSALLSGYPVAKLSVSGFGAWGDLFDAMLATGASSDAPLASPDRFVCKSRIKMYTTMGFPPAPKTYIHKDNPFSDPPWQEPAVDVDVGVYSFTPNADIGHFVKSVKIGVYSYAYMENYDFYSPEFSKRSIYFWRKVEWRDAAQAGTAWQVPSAKGLDVFRARLVELGDEYAAHLLSSDPTTPGGEFDFIYQEFPVAVSIEWNFLAFPPPEESGS